MNANIGQLMPSFNKTRHLFPIKDREIFLSHCAVAAMHGAAAGTEREITRRHSQEGNSFFSQYGAILAEFRQAAGGMLNTSADNIAFITNTAQAMNMIALGYPFESGDQIISYQHEYPSNHYPWRLPALADKAELVLLGNTDENGTPIEDDRPVAWSMEELERKTTSRTRIVAISHVQFTSGFAADLPRLGAFCRERNIDLIVDAAQSLGCLPLDPEACGVAAMAASGWKWLMGPVGSGVMYVSPQLREKLAIAMVGVDTMQHGARADYLNRDWSPVEEARRLEFSTQPVSLVAGLRAAIERGPLEYGNQAIADEMFAMQGRLLASIDSWNPFRLLKFPASHRSGIVSLTHDGTPAERKIALRKLQKSLLAAGVNVTVRGGYLRLAPHYPNTLEEIGQATEVLRKALQTFTTQ